MHADGDWQAVEGVLSQDMATKGKYLKTWKLKLSTTKMVSAVFHLNKEAKPELKDNFTNETPPFCFKPKYLGTTLDRMLTYRRHLEPHHRKLEATGWLGQQRCKQPPKPWSTDSRLLRSCLVPQSSHPSHWPCHQRLANCDWMPASCTDGQNSYPRGHPTCWASSQSSHAVFNTHAMELGHLLHSVFTCHRVGMHSISYQDTHL